MSQRNKLNGVIDYTKSTIRSRNDVMWSDVTWKYVESDVCEAFLTADGQVVVTGVLVARSHVSHW